MKNNFTKPKILVSKCIEFDSCRYNGQVISSDFVKKLKNFADFEPVCAEVEIGLGIPRNPIRIVEKKGMVKLIQPETKKDVTKDMIDFSNRFLDDLEIDGVILKSKSPSCGIKDVKIYPSEKKSPALRRDKGFFGGAVIEKFSLYPVEDEDRLRNHIIKENFLRRIFTFAAFRELKKKKSINELIKFHSKNKFLIMSYNQKELKELGNITANRDKKQIFDVLSDYEYHLKLAFSKSPRCTSNINVLSHSFGYVSGKLKIDEKKLFLDTIEQFRNGHIGLTIPISIMKSWIARFDEDYLKEQTYFNPYPNDLMEVENVNFCAARDFWK